MYYGQFSNPKVDEYLHTRFFSNNPRNLTCLEAGAEEGLIIPSCRFFEETLGWTCINVEPNPLLFSKLKVNRPNSINVNYALVPEHLSNTNVFFQGYSVGLGYVIDETPPPHVEFTEKFAGKVHRKTEIHSIPGISYDGLIHKLSITSLALLVLDIEGLEISILKSLSTGSILPNVLCVEDNLNEQAEITNILNKLGYNFDNKVHVNLFYYRKGYA